jgi:hypothetical protein
MHDEVVSSPPPLLELEAAEVPEAVDAPELVRATALPAGVVWWFSVCRRSERASQ